MSETEEPWSYTLSLPNDPRATPVARRTLRLVLTLHGLPHLVEAAELLAAELVSNAVRHTKGPANIRLDWTGTVFRITVWDTDPRLRLPANRNTSPTSTRETGRGLSLVDACAKDWGWFTSIITAEPDRVSGKFVWCELDPVA